MRHFTLPPHRRTRHHRRSRHAGPESLKRDPVHAGPWPGVGRFPLRGVPRLLTTPGQTWWIPNPTNFIRKDSGCWRNLNLEIISPGSRTRDFTEVSRYFYSYAMNAFIRLTTVKSRVRLPGDIISRLRLRQYMSRKPFISSLWKYNKIWNPIYFGLAVSFLVETLRFSQCSPPQPLEIFCTLESPEKPT